MNILNYISDAILINIVIIVTFWIVCACYEIDTGKRKVILTWWLRITLASIPVAFIIMIVTS